MLSPDYLNAFVRDERAWRRAAQQPLDDEAAPPGSACSREGNWLVFRRGTSDNAFSLKFANTLRASSVAESHDTAASSRTRSAIPRPSWKITARCSPDMVHPDPLQQLLARNLQRRGAAAALERRAATHLRRPPCMSPSARTAQRLKALARAAQELADLEAHERQRLVALSCRRWNAALAAHVGAAAAMLQAQEVNERRSVFREWQAWHGNAAATLEVSVVECTGMTPHQLKAACRIVGAEALQRRRTEAVERQDRELYERLLQLARLRALERELQERRRRESRPRFLAA